MLVVVLVFTQIEAKAQLNVSGYVFSEDNVPISFATVFVRETAQGTVTDQEGRYFMTLQPGSYTFIFSSVGFQSHRVELVLDEKDVVKNIWLKHSVAELNQIVVKANKRDPAYAIIQNAIKAKGKYKTQVERMRANVYAKATEVVSEKERKRRKAKQEAEAEKELDPFEAEKLKKATPRINMVELEATLNYQAPEDYKEERTAFRRYGSTSGLFMPRFNESNYNFYENLVYFPGVTETPIISPLSTTSILTYKFKLESSTIENGKLVYKIAIIPRKKGNSSCKGYIYINDSLWNINRIETDLYKGALKFYDAFSVSLNYEALSDSVWMINRKEFRYETKQGRFTNFLGKTVIKISDFDLAPVFPKKYFRNEISITTKEAYDRDSSYWQKIRPEPLTKDEQKVVRRADSIKAVRESKAYKDSMERLYNKITFTEVMYDGVGFRKNEERYLFLSSILSLTEFSVVGGFRFGPYVTYFHRYESGRFFVVSGNANLGVKNLDPQGNFSFRYRYDPHHFADVYMYAGRNFSSINYYDAYLNLLQVSNYILNDNFMVAQRRELFNGFFFRASIAFNHRRSVEDYDSRTFVNDIIGDEPNPMLFEGYKALITEWDISYTPAQRYITEPNRKIIVGSKYPTFRLSHEKGWSGIAGSTVNFDYMGFSVSQTVPTGIFGVSKYRMETGKFLNTKNLKFIDYKRFRQSDPFLYSNPLYSFQLLDTSLAISGLFLEGHYIHHFNGAIINNVPLLKKTRIQVVAGGGFLWVDDDNYNYQELFTGVERTFKLGVRRRLRVGLFGVVANSSIGSFTPSYKISLDVIDTWKQNWSF